MRTAYDSEPLVKRRHTFLPAMSDGQNGMAAAAQRPESTGGARMHRFILCPPPSLPAIERSFSQHLRTLTIARRQHISRFPNTCG
ncbi:hypothetical protein TNCV_2950691 [Trichonephila clavipes]|nr:hypothetical protein TNCV_2950691 [Trichonephila clavipes]